MPTYAIHVQDLANGNNTQWVTRQQKTGYLCAIEEYGVQLKPLGDGTFSHQAVLTWLTGAVTLLSDDVLEQPFDTVGSWVDEGILYLDVCKWYASLDEALVAGHEQNQLAIWDIANQVAIYV